MPYRYDTPSNPHVASIGALLGRRGETEAQLALRVADARARAAQTVGQAQGQAALARGQAWGQGVSSIGQTLAAIPQQMQQQKRQAMADEMGTIEIQNARAGQAAAAKATDDKAVLGSAMGAATTGRDPNAVKQQLAQLGRGDLIPIFDKTWTDLEASRTTLQKTKTEISALEADYFGALASGIKAAKFDPMAVDWALSEAEADGHDTKQIRALL